MTATARPTDFTTAPAFTSRTGSDAYLDEHGRDEVWTIEDICEVFAVTKNVVYKLNQQGAIPYRPFGRHCRYLRSDVLSYFMARDKDAAPGPGEFERLPLDQLPKVFKRRRSVPEPKKKGRDAETSS